MYILMSIFAVSLLGTAGMIFYKMAALRRHEEIAVSAHPIEHHLGSFFRRIFQLLGLRVRKFFNEVFVPFLIDIARIIVIALIRLWRKVRTFVKEFIEARKNNGPTQKGATSFFLKDISEHKKNLKNGNGN